MKDDDYLSADTTQKLLKLGYNGRVDTIFNKDRIHFYEAAKWLRNERLHHVCVDCIAEFWGIGKWYYTVSGIGEFSSQSDDRTYNTYEEALVHGIEAVLEL